MKYLLYLLILISPRAANAVYALIKCEELLNGLPESYP